MLKLIVFSLCAMSFSTQAMNVKNLRQALNDEAVQTALAGKDIESITDSPCNRMIGSFCLDVVTREEEYYSIYGNNHFNTIEVWKREIMP